MSVTIILIIFTCLISYQAIQNGEMYSKLLFHPYSMKHRGEWYRLITHGFVHSNQNFAHLLINMFVLYQIGRVVEIIFVGFFGAATGRVTYVLLYLSAIVFSSIPSYLKHQDNPGYSAVGASGATSALVFSFILFQPWEWFDFPPLPGIVLALGYLWYSDYMSKRNLDNIGHDAHKYGAIYGLLATLALCFAFNPDTIDFILEQFLAGPQPPRYFSLAMF